MTNQMTLRTALGSALRPQTLSKPLRLLAASALAVGIAGCGHRFDNDRTPAAFAEPVKTIEQRHPIEIEKARAHLALATPSNAHGLNAYQQERLRHFIGLWRNEGYGQLTVSGNNREAMAGVRDILIERVVPVGAVEVGRYDASQPGVKISFGRYVAEGPKCGKWTTNLAEQTDNQEYGNYGCTAQHNLAAMIANPKDLQTPRDQSDWTDGDRKDFMWRAFKTGAETAANTSAVDKAGNVSSVK